MIAVPVKTEKEEGVLAPLFGHAKYFSFIDEKGNVTTHKNNADGGVKVVAWLVSMGVKTMVLNHVGEKPFHLLAQANIEVYFPGNERIMLSEALEKLQNGVLEKVTMENYVTLLGGDDHHHDHGSHEANGGCCCS